MSCFIQHNIALLMKFTKYQILFDISYILFLYLFYIQQINIKLINFKYMCVCVNKIITWDQTPTVHREVNDWGDVCVDVFLISSHAGISHTSLIGRFLGSVQAPSAILIVNDVFTSCTHSSSRIRTPVPQEVEQSLHGPPRHLRKYSF